MNGVWPQGLCTALIVSCGRHAEQYMVDGGGGSSARGNCCGAESMSETIAGSYAYAAAVILLEMENVQTGWPGRCQPDWCSGETYM